MVRRLVMTAIIVALASATAFHVSPVGKRHSTNVTVASIALNETDPHLLDRITFTVAVPRDVKYPGINVLCFQDGRAVYAEGGYVTTAFVLGAGSFWEAVGGPATCRADLYSIDRSAVETVLDSITFNAAG